MDLNSQLTPKLKALRLSGILETLEVRNRQAIEDKLAFVEFLERLLEDEIERRAQKQLSLCLRRASFSAEKSLEGSTSASTPASTAGRSSTWPPTCARIFSSLMILACGPCAARNLRTSTRSSANATNAAPPS